MVRYRATAGMLMIGSSIIWPMVSGVIYCALKRPFIVLFQQQYADDTDDGVVVGKDAGYICAPLDRAAQALDGVGGVQLRRMLLRRPHISQHIVLCLVHECGEL